MEKGLTLSNFEPNAVIRGFQLTVVGSMFLLLFLRQVDSSGAALRLIYNILPKFPDQCLPSSSSGVFNESRIHTMN